jgi:hypothetical protein
MMTSKKDVSQAINDALSEEIPFGFGTAVKLYEEGIKFYKGVGEEYGFKNKNHDIQYAKPRKSIGKSNVHTLLLSEILPSWNSYPKRNYCNIFTLSKDVASEYAARKKDGTVLYSVFPYYDALLGIAPVPNIWDAFGIPLQELGGLLDNLADLNDRSLKANMDETQELNNFLTSLNKKSIEDGKVLEKKIETILEDKKSFPNPEKIREFATKMLVSGNCTAYLDDYLKPKKDRFHLKKISDDLDFLKGKDYEVWTEQPCLLIRADIVE